MTTVSYPPKNLVTEELLTKEIGFSDSAQMVEELNQYLQLSTKFDSEYYSKQGKEFQGNNEDVLKVTQTIEKHAERAGSMEFYALVTATDEKTVIPRIADAILLKTGLIKALDVVNGLLQYQKQLQEPQRVVYIESVIQRWIFKFCEHIFQLKDFKSEIPLIFAKELKKDKDAFRDFYQIIAHFSKQQLSMKEDGGYDADNFQKLYIILSNLILVYFQQGNSIPFFLQQVFLEFQKHQLFDPESEEDDTSLVYTHRLLVKSDTKPFFANYRQINTPMKKSVFLGIISDYERKIVIEELCELRIKMLADMYVFLGNMLQKGVTVAQGGDWLTNLTCTITEVVKDKKVVEDSSIPKDTRAVFGDTIELFKQLDPNDSMAKKVQNVISDESEETSDTASSDALPPPKESSSQALEIMEIEDIPNLVAAENLEELEKMGSKNIVIVQDAGVLDLIVKNWKIRGDITFPELIEFVRIPFQILQPGMPGIPKSRKILSFLYFIVLDVPVEIIEKILKELMRTRQLKDQRAEQLLQIYPIAQERLSPLVFLNKDVRKFMDGYGNISNVGIFFEKCQAIRSIFMDNYSYMESLISYWSLVQEVFASIAKGTAMMGNITDPNESAIETFVANRNDEYVKAYEKALLIPECRHLKVYFKKKYSPELRKHFLNIKVKNDLIQMSKVEAANISTR